MTLRREVGFSKHAQNWMGGDAKRRRRLIMEALTEKPTRSVRDLAVFTDCPATSLIAHDLNMLERMGYIRRSFAGRSRATTVLVGFLVVSKAETEAINADE